MSIPVSALDNLAELVTPEKEILWREGPGGKMLAYVDARWVMGVLDTLVGPTNWRRLHAFGEGGKVACGVGILIDMGDGQPPVWVDKWDGAGETDIEGEKGSFSDSFKRAAVNWNIGRDLYAMKPSGTARQPVQPQQPQRAADAPQQPVYEQIMGEMEGGTCPVHGTPWFLKPAGTSKTTGKPYNAFWTCQGKTEGRYCQEKPSKAWMAAHER